MSTINDLELTELMLRAKNKLAAASEAIMHGNNKRAFMALSDLEFAARDAQVRLNALKFSKEGS